MTKEKQVFIKFLNDGNTTMEIKKSEQRSQNNKKKMKLKTMIKRKILSSRILHKAFEEN